MHYITMICVLNDELNILQIAKQTTHYTICLFRLSIYTEQTTAVDTVVLAHRKIKIKIRASVKKK